MTKYIISDLTPRLRYFDSATNTVFKSISITGGESYFAAFSPDETKVAVLAGV